MNKTFQEIYSKPKENLKISDCNFYHTMDIPDIGVVEGQWDLRNNTHKILGNVDFHGKRVLDIGTASGFNCFYMEKMGADVIAYDLSEEQSWDIVPFSRFDYKNDSLWQKEQIKKLNNSFWLAHQKYNSSARMVNGSVYDIPEGIGQVDIAVYSAILIHLRDPFLALEKGLALTQDKVIITGNILNSYSFPIIWSLVSLLSRFGIVLPLAIFKPDYKTHKHGVWWTLTPEIIKAFIRVLGFEDVKIKYHYSAKYMGKKKLCFTIVGQRSKIS